MAPAVTVGDVSLLRNWLIRGINARLVQVLARHKHLSTTQRYIDVNENALRNAVELL